MAKKAQYGNIIIEPFVGFDTIVPKWFITVRKNKLA
jgi:hypothetical protein